MEQSSPARVQRRVFRVVSLLLPVLFLSLCELGLRAWGVGGSYPLFIDAPDLPGYRYANPDVIRRYVDAAGKLPEGIEPIFFQAKNPREGLRIAVTNRGPPCSSSAMRQGQALGPCSSSSPEIPMSSRCRSPRPRRYWRIRLCAARSRASTSEFMMRLRKVTLVLMCVHLSKSSLHSV